MDMDKVMKKRVSIGIAVGCIALAVIITVITNRSGSIGGSAPSRSVLLMCVNPQCGNIFKLDAKDTRRNNEEAGSATAPPVFKCPKCGQMSAYIAMKCPKCGTVFIPNYQDPEAFDKCSKCGYSKHKELNKKK
jgi:DNA-directed RNA polymerase subunit M/transcription elongation factor TFIIS